MQISRERAAKLGQETVRILREGQYRSETGALVELGGLRQRAVEGTRSYPPDVPLPPVGHGDRATRIEVTNETTLAAARRLVDQGLRVAALNFASARHPGGGFLNGSRAQEESLARSSGLYACLVGNPMYEFHQAQHDALYTNYAIYSPDVPVIRTDEGTLLDQPWPCSFITSPAVNAKVVLDRDRSRREEIQKAMEQRIHKVLAIAAAHGHPALVLGAWGCGVFGNDTQEIADLFAKALAGSFRGVFEQITFAIIDGSEDQKFLGPFRRVFGSRGEGGCQAWLREMNEGGTG
jgi:uncharacterized protein (TIGR02452 family)